MHWLYQGKPIKDITDLPNHENIVGFVYCITDTKTGRFYIGKKSLFHTRKKRITQKEKAETKTRRVFKKVTKESDWATYTGSCDELNRDIKTHSLNRFSRVIMELCYSKKYLNYCEVSYQMKLDVLQCDTYNGNILGRYFRKDMEHF